MASQVTRQQLTRWLLKHGFQKQTGRAGGHEHYTDPAGLTITVPGHGPNDLTKKLVGMILRALEACGYGDKKKLREEIRRS